MTARPILFSGPMIRALLEGRKTQTRRVVKPRADKNFGPRCVLQPHEIAGEVNGGKYQNCPYGHPGDLLWVRESFWGCDLPGYGDQPCVVYDDEWIGKEYRPSEARPWALKFGRIPSIHMPRDCSRLTLRITDVRVQRLQDISEPDAKAEGADELIASNCSSEERALLDLPNYEIGTSHRNGYAALWESIHGPGSWLTNPWVWALTFDVIKANVDQVKP